MISISIRTYKRIAVVSWLVVSALVGLTVALYFNVPSKQYVFYVFTGIGVVSLVAVNLPSKKVKEKGSNEVVSKEESADEAREWLDKFLVKQQD